MNYSTSDFPCADFYLNCVSLLDYVYVFKVT
jgi:hypothetical protein